MINPDHIDFTPKLIVFLLNIFGWFLLIAYTIYRFGCFKKRIFSILIFVYFGRAIARVSDIVVTDFDVSEVLWMTIATNMLTIYGFYILTDRIITLNDKLHEKDNLSAQPDADNQ